MNKKELIDILDIWIKDEWNMKGGMVRALALKGRKEKAEEIALEVTVRGEAIEQVIRIIKTANCIHEKTVALNEEGHAGIYCVACGEKLEDGC